MSVEQRVHTRDMSAFEKKPKAKANGLNEMNTFLARGALEAFGVVSMSTSRVRRLFSATKSEDRKPARKSLLARLLGTSGHASSIETMERREMLSATRELLPEGSSWVDWGNGVVAAKNGSYVVTFTEDLGKDNAALRAQDVAQALGVTAWGFEGIGRGKWARFDSAVPITSAQVRTLTADFPFVSWIEPDQIRKVQRVPNDPQYGDQYWLKNNGQVIQGTPGLPGADINIETAWDTSVGSRSVIVGVIDTGVDYNHPDLAPNIWNNTAEIAGDNIDNDGNGYVDDIRGFDFGEQDNDPMDFPDINDPNNEIFAYPHGTPVAGLIGAAGNNGIGVSGVNWLVSILPLKIADEFGNLSTSAIVAAHDYVTALREAGVNVAVTNNSYGAYLPEFYEDTPEGVNAERDAIQRWINSGGIFVASAGNGDRRTGIGIDLDNSDVLNFPSSYDIPGIISVAAMDKFNNLSSYSNYGAESVDIAAPADETLTTASNGATDGGGYTYFSGTSASGPIVAGAAALLKAVKPSASAVEIRETIINTAEPVAALTGKVASGGVLNVTRAMQALLNDGPVVRGFTPGPVTTNVDPETGNPLRSLTVTFSENIAAAGLNAGAVQLRNDGANNIFGDFDDSIITISSVTHKLDTLGQPILNQVVVTANVSQFAEENYRLTLFNASFRDVLGNRLNGNASTGTDANLTFRVVNSAGALEDNNTLVTATPVSFGASGTAQFNSLLIGDGTQTLRDVDLFKIVVPGPGQFSAEVTARRLPGGSSLDSVLRLFDANGVQLSINDQFFGQDSYIDFFLRSAGTYYIGVSGFGNSNYDPEISGSGTTQSTGAYSIKFTSTTSTPDIVNYNASSNSVVGQPAFPLAIPPGGLTQGTTTAAITVADTRTILDVNVSINLRHPNVSDLDIDLIGPDGTTVRLFTRLGGTGDDLGTRDGSGNPVLYTTFDDEQATSITSASPPFAGNFRPEQGLSGFDGKVAAGNWTLRIFDFRSLNAGSLIDWKVEFRFANDVFGPFEANDTISVAKAIPNINGSGSGSVTAFIGDGGFGSLDRDLYSFTASPGTTLNASVDLGTGTLDSALRLFDSSGTQVLLSNPSTVRTSSITNFVFANGGTFYLGVSEARNTAYNPFAASSGVAGTTTGTYTLNVNVTPGVSDSASTAVGNNLEFGLRDNGVLLDPTTGIGVKAGNIEFLTNATAFFGLTVDGTGFTNRTADTQNPVAITNLSDPRNNRIQAVSQFRGVKLERALTSGIDDRFIAVDVYLTNTSGSVLNNLSFAEGFNPNPGLTLDEQTAVTNNDIIRNGRVAVASFANNTYLDGVFIALASPDAPSTFGSPKATVLPGGTTVRDSGVLVSQPSIDPNGLPADSQLALSYFIQNLQPGATATFRYFILTATSLNDLTGQLDTLNSNTGGEGHFTFNATSPTTETIGGQQVPTYSYRVYYPEGFLGPNIFSFLPISNPNDQEAKVVVIQHFEGVADNVKDRVVPAVDSNAAAQGLTLTVPGRSRKGVDLNTPELFASGFFDPAIRFRPYAVEIRSDRPIAATFSYYDLVQISAGPVAVGESFTPETSTTWTFGDVQQRGTENFTTGINSYIVLQNPQNTVAQVVTRVYDAELGVSFRTVRFVQQNGRAGVYLGTGPSASPDILFDAENTTTEEGATLEALIRAEYQRRGVSEAIIQQLLNADRRYSVSVSSDVPIVAAKSTYNPLERQATGTVGNEGVGTTTGVLTEGQFGLRNGSETIGILNTNTQTATILFSFLFQNGTTARQTVDVAANSSKSFQVSSIPNFPSGQPYSVFYESNVPVSLGATVPVTQNGVNDAFSVTSSTKAYTFWGFGEGFRPGDNVDWNPNVAGVQAHPGLSENLRIYNPSSLDVTVEITLSFDLEPGTETFRRTISGRRVAEFNIHECITGNRRLTNQSYGLFVKSATPVVAEMNHYDLLFPGGFATLGTPLGRTSLIT